MFIINYNLSSFDFLLFQHQQVIYTEESVSEEHSEEKDNDSLGDSKHWDSGVGSSSERTSTFSVSEGIRRFERDFRFSEHYPDDNLVGSVDSLLSVHDDTPPMLPEKMKSIEKEVAISNENWKPSEHVEEFIKVAKEILFITQGKQRTFAAKI